MQEFSLPRNPIIAHIFRVIRLSENIGSGFHKMIHGWESHYPIPPRIEGDFDYYKITFPFEALKSGKPIGGTIGETIGEAIGGIIGGKLGDSQRRILEEISKNRYVSELSKIVCIATRNIEENLKKRRVCSGGLALIREAIGSGDWTLKGYFN